MAKEPCPQGGYQPQGLGGNTKKGKMKREKKRTKI
jgi:hypothetical protein